MRHIRRFLVAAFALALVFGASGGAAYAQAGVPGGPFASSFQIQNLGTAAATCSYTMYKDDGTQAFAPSAPLSIAQNDSIQVLTTQVQGFPSGQFGGVVSCDQNVAVVVNWSDANKGDVYVATSSPASTLFAPSIYNNYFSYYTTIRIQNASGAAQTVKVEYYGPGSATPVFTSPDISLPVNGSATVDQNTVAQLQKNVAYSAKIVGSGPLAAVVSIFGSGNTAKQLYSYSATTGGSAQPSYVPLVFSNYFGYTSAITVLNVGSAAANVRITYINAQGQTATTQEFTNIAPNAAQVVLQSQVTQLARNQAYGAKIESLNGQQLAVSVNQSIASTGRAATYLGTAAGSTTSIAPTVFRNYFGYNSAITCQNVGTAATDVSISYSGAGPKDKSVATGLANGASVVILQAFETGLPATNYIGSATLKSSGQPLVCVVTQDRNATPALSGAAIDYFQAYVTIPQ